MEINNKTFGSLGGKKYVFVWVVFIVATFALFFKYGTLVEWGVIVGGLAALYFNAETKQKKDELVENTKIEVKKLEVTGELAK